MEIWKDIENYEGLYQISNLGRVKSLSRKVLNRGLHPFYTKEKIMSKRNCRGYITTQLFKNAKSCQFRVCRLVATHFIENTKNKPCVNHIDGDKENDNAENLEWCTYKENMHHAKQNGLTNYKKGKENSSSISVKCVKTKKTFETINEAAKDIGLHGSTLSRMLRGEYKNTTTIRYAEM